MVEPKEFVTKTSDKQQAFGTGAVRDTSEGKGRYDLLPPMCLARLAKLYERGAKHYADNNWTLGIPSTRFMESGLRHIFQYLEGDRSEDHLSAGVFGLFGIMFNEIMVERGLRDPKLHNLPNYLPDTETPKLSEDMERVLRMRAEMERYWRATAGAASVLSMGNPPFPASVGQEYGIIPLRLSEGTLIVGCTETPTTERALEIRLVLNHRVIFDVMQDAQFENLFKGYEKSVMEYEKTKKPETEEFDPQHG